MAKKEKKAFRTPEQERQEIEKELKLAKELSEQETKLQEDLTKAIQDKCASLEEDFDSIRADVKRTSTVNMNEEIRLMESFTEKVRVFNDAYTDFLMAMGQLKTVGEVK